MKLILLALAVVGLASCATPGNGFKAKMQSWVGKPSDELIARWGVPTAERDLASGKKAIEYVNHLGSTTDVSHTPYMGATASTSNKSCRATFLVSEEGIVESGSWHGYCY